MYALLAHPSAQRELDALPKAIRAGLKAVLHALAEDSRSRRFDLKALRAVDGEPPALRLRVGDYRVILRIDHEKHEVVVAKVGHRSSVYRGLGSGLD
jgi:mRNA interferase RelE/StbE